MKKFTKEKKLIAFLILIITILIGTNIYSLYNLDISNKQIETVKNLNSKCKKTNNKTSDQNKEYASEIKDLKYKCSYLNSQIYDTKQKLSKLKNQQSKIDELNDTIDEKDKTISDLKEQLNNFESYEDDYYDSDYYDGDNYYTDEDTSYTVYITEYGSKYHSSGCRYLWNSKIAIDINEAISEGYEPCSICNP